MFSSILDSTVGLTLPHVLICTGVSLLMGITIALAYMSHGTYSKNFVVTLVLLPVLVQTVIMMVNGNLGTSVAVLGAFSLVRFRSVPGSSRDISSIFLSMAIGLATGMGYIGFAMIMTCVISLMLVILSKIPFGERKAVARELKITIPENLDYTGIFDDLFDAYTKKASLIRVKTTNLGSLYELNYDIILKDISREKELIDAVRCRNGNLTVICGRPLNISEEL